MAHGPLTQNQKLEAAARLKAIIESGETFDPRDADAVAELLAAIPRSGPSFRWHKEVDGERTEGAIGSRATRCGAWLVDRWGNAFDIRHIASTEDQTERNIGCERYGGAGGWIGATCAAGACSTLRSVRFATRPGSMRGTEPAKEWRRFCA